VSTREYCNSYPVGHIGVVMNKKENTQSFFQVRARARVRVCVCARVCARVRVRVCANRTCHCPQVCVGSVTRRKNQLTLVRALHRAARELNAGAAARADGAAERSG
jgi:hypothetical protein